MLGLFNQNVQVQRCQRTKEWMSKWKQQEKMA